MNNLVVIAGAGSGKTSFLVQKAVADFNSKILILTYTEANEDEIRRRFLRINGGVPNNVKIQTWFSFLLRNWVKPFQGTFNEALHNYNITGLHLTNKASGLWFYSKRDGRNIYYSEVAHFFKHYFDKKQQIYSDKISKFSFNSNKVGQNNSLERLSNMYDSIYIDEAQDLAGYDLELIKNLLKSTIEIFVVFDPRQVTYLTHHERKHEGYKNGGLKAFLLDKCKSLIKNSIDETTFSKSHRNNNIICEYSSRLYNQFQALQQCDCEECHNNNIEHQGIYLVKKDDVEKYLETYKAVQIRWNSIVNISGNSVVFTYGNSKGLTFPRVLLYLTPKMKEWVCNNSINLEPVIKSKFYVGLTRAKYSVAFVFDYDENIEYAGCVKFKFD